MPVAHYDRRTQRTRRLLQKALMELILEKGYDSVTVEDITERADLGRTTFYLHFKDKEELLLKSLEAVAEDLVVQIGQPEEGSSYREPGKAIRVVFEHARDNASLYHIILNGGAAVKALQQLHFVVAETAASFIEERVRGLGKKLDVPVDILAAYFATSLLGFLTWWLRRGMPESLDDITAVYVQLVMGGMLGVLGE